jgi:hypothetical protein
MSVHRTFNTLDPKLEIAVAQKPEGTVKIMVYEGDKTKLEFTMERKNAFDFAMEMLQHVYRLGEAG